MRDTNGGGIHQAGQIDHGLQCAANLGVLVAVARDCRNDGVNNDQLHAPDGFSLGLQAGQVCRWVE